jgi:hypothetical protein
VQILWNEYFAAGRVFVSPFRRKAFTQRAARSPTVSGKIATAFVVVFEGLPLNGKTADEWQS